MLQSPLRHFLEGLRQPRNIVDVVLVFLLVYGLLKLIRGTRAAPMAARPAAIGAARVPRMSFSSP